MNSVWDIREMSVKYCFLGKSFFLSLKVLESLWICL